ncbi:MAG: DUF3379 family protein [Pseudohongiella sp.]|uniref:DUF3379 family protein n=1 Tax=Pseudohongiella sp. TaxID=1979412 RepID=UPI00349FEF12
MDDLEFRTRAFSNPLDEQEDFRAAADASPERRQLLGELNEFEKDLQRTLMAVDIPGGLKRKLNQHARPASPLRSRRFLALAASLVVATGLALNLFLQPGLSAQDLALHDELVEHMHQEAPSFDNRMDIDINNDSGISWNEIETILAAAGTSLKTPEELAALHMIFARLCGLGGSRSAHLVARGEHGPISIIFIRTAPVSRGVELRDDRFQGRIIPVNEGNMAVIGEKNEPLDRYESMLRDNIEWSI